MFHLVSSLINIKPNTNSLSIYLRLGYNGVRRLKHCSRFSGKKGLETNVRALFIDYLYRLIVHISWHAGQSYADIKTLEMV